MKKILGILMAVTSISLISCEEELDVNSRLNYPPTLVSVYPKSSVKVGNEFDVTVVLADGPGTPLKDVKLTLTDADENEIFSVTENLSGTMDTVVVESETFSSSDLPLGDYKLSIIATDSRGNERNVVQAFKVANQLYAANQNEMYIAGAFNGWGSGVMELISDNTWEIKEIDLQAGPFKFKNRTDWSDTDWGDSNCDFTMEITSGGGADTKCGYSGLVNVRFNDETLKYTVLPSVSYAANLASLYLLGSFNNFAGPEPKFSLVADNTWEIAEFRMKKGDIFKFAEKTSFEGKNYGDANLDGKAEEFGPNITLGDSYADAFYKITFNDKTRLYSLTVVRYPYPTNLYLVGGSTSANWTPANSIPFRKTAEGKFEIYAYLTTGGGGFKFLQVQDWAGDWGMATEGTIEQEGEDNVSVAADGFYRVIVDFTNMTYSTALMNWGVIGSARTGDGSGWDADDNMTFVGGLGSYKWTKTITLFNGELKFRANDSWDVNLGDTGANGSLEYGGDNLQITAGTYVVELILAPTGYTYTVTLQ